MIDYFKDIFAKPTPVHLISSEKNQKLGNFSKQNFFTQKVPLDILNAVLKAQGNFFCSEDGKTINYYFLNKWIKVRGT